MALSDQLLGQVRNNPFGTAVSLRRATLVQGCNLCNSHFSDDPSGHRPNGWSFRFPWGKFSISLFLPARLTCCFAEKSSGSFLVFPSQLPSPWYGGCSAARASRSKLSV